MRNRHEKRATEFQDSPEVMARSGAPIRVVAELAAQPGTGIRPGSLRRPRGNALRLGNFVNSHAREHTQLHEFRGLWIDRAEFGKCLVQIKQRIVDWNSNESTF